MDTKKAKTVATIDINIQWPPKVTRQQWLEESITDHNNCVLCGTVLMMKHKVDFITGSVSEEAHCEACGVRNRSSNYSLQ